jgi:hypothetical protein
MAYKYTNSKGIDYFLHSTEVTLKGGRVQTIYFFAKVPKNPKGSPVESLPAGMVVVESVRNAFPVIKKK